MNILKRPIITEKMTKDSEKSGRYGFIVDDKASKIQIKQAVEAMYKVSVESVNTMNTAGKVSMRNTKGGVQIGKKGVCKKAIITLKKGETIDFYSSI